MAAVYCKVKKIIAFFLIEQVFCEGNLTLQTFKSIQTHENIIAVPSTATFLGSINFRT